MQMLLPFLQQRPPKEKTHVQLDANVNTNALKILSRMIAHAGSQSQREKNK
jgi:hypothetical protein